MIFSTPADVAGALSPSMGATLNGDSCVPITTVVTDSRQVEPGSLFVALAGERVDGHDYVAAVMEAGAAAALVTRIVPGAGPQILVTDAVAALGELARVHLARMRAANPDLRVVGVTGSAGKTTTKDLLSAMLTARGEVVFPEKSFNNEIGLPLTVLRTGPTTRTLVVEMGADVPGNLAELTTIAPLDIAVVLMVGRAHLLGFGDVDGVAAEKSTILDGLTPAGIAVLNCDDGAVAAMATRLDPGRVRFFGETAAADYRASDVAGDDEGRARFTITEGEGATSVRLALVGVHHITNALAAFAVGRLLGIDAAVLADALAETGPLSAHRMHVVDTPGGVRIIDDAYNANPESMRAALRTLADISNRTGRRSVAVLGQMRELGTGAILEHDSIGRLVVRLNIDKLLAVGDGTRPLYSGAYQEGSWGEEAAHVDTLAQARDWLDTELMAGDIVLFKSSNGAGLAGLASELIADLSAGGTT